MTPKSIVTQSEKSPPLSDSEGGGYDKLYSVGIQAPTELKRSARMRTDSVRNLSAKADPNPARKTRKRVLTKKK